MPHSPKKARILITKFRCKSGPNIMRLVRASPYSSAMQKKCPMRFAMARTSGFLRFSFLYWLSAASPGTGPASITVAGHTWYLIESLWYKTHLSNGMDGPLLTGKGPIASCCAVFQCTAERQGNLCHRFHKTICLSLMCMDPDQARSWKPG